MLQTRLVLFQGLTVSSLSLRLLNKELLAITDADAVSGLLNPEETVT